MLNPCLKNFRLLRRLEQSGLHAPNSGTITDIICCPGLDYCALATARSIPIAQEISKRFQSLTDQNEIGDLKIKISGCINACGHHHVGHIGILGLSKAGIESYQITLGGDGAPFQQPHQRQPKNPRNTAFF
jgi:sulfite reductase (NADPH) hemoprotein beta-component